MEIKITPLTPRHNHLEGSFRVRNNFYWAKFHSAGIVTEVKKSDDWLENEARWVSRSEIPFVTAMRHVQLNDLHLVEGSLTPIVRAAPFYVVKMVEKFPSNEECRDLIYEYCEYATGEEYNFYQNTVDESEVKNLVKGFNYRNHLFMRTGSCLYKAYILKKTSPVTFAEEIYVNTFIALEAIVEIIKQKRGFLGRNSRNKAVDVIAEHFRCHYPGSNFNNHEEEMREEFRNNIIHPLRHRSGIQIAQPFMMMGFIYEDLSIVDWLFKELINGDLV